MAGTAAPVSMANTAAFPFLAFSAVLARSLRSGRCQSLSDLPSALSNKVRLALHSFANRCSLPKRRVPKTLCIVSTAFLRLSRKTCASFAQSTSFLVSCCKSHVPSLGLLNVSHPSWRRLFSAGDVDELVNVVNWAYRGKPVAQFANARYVMSLLCLVLEICKTSASASVTLID